MDALGFPHAIAVSAANVTDRKGALQALGHSKTNLNEVHSILADRGYVGEPCAQGVRDILRRNVTCKSPNVANLKIMPKRWIVERSFVRPEKNRRLWKNCGRWLNTSLQFFNLALLLNRL